MKNMRFTGIIVACLVLAGGSIHGMDSRSSRQGMSCWQLCVSAITGFLMISEGVQAQTHWNIQGKCGACNVLFENVQFPAGTSKDQAGQTIRDLCCKADNIDICISSLSVGRGTGKCDNGKSFCPRVHHINFNNCQKLMVQEALKKRPVARAQAAKNNGTPA